MNRYAWPPNHHQFWAITRKFSKRKCRLFAVAWCRKQANEIKHPECLALIDLAEQFADGLVSRHRLRQQRRVVHRWAAAEWAKQGQRGSWVGTWAAWNAAVESITTPCQGYVGFDSDYGLLAEEIFGNPFRPVTFDPAWQTDTVVSLAKGMYESRDFSAMPILADALQDAGCDNAEILTHCRDESLTHVRGCWVVDILLGRT